MRNSHTITSNINKTTKLSNSSISSSQVTYVKKLNIHKSDEAIWLRNPNKKSTLNYQIIWFKYLKPYQIQHINNLSISNIYTSISINNNMKFKEQQKNWKFENHLNK